MIDPMPQTRLSMAEIFGHPWLNEGPIATPQEVYTEFKARFKSHSLPPPEQKEPPLTKEIPVFNQNIDLIKSVDHDSSKVTRFTSSHEPSLIMNELIN